MATAKESKNTIHSRLPVTLTHEDNRCLIALKHSLESRLGERMSWAKVVRLALRKLADSEGVTWK